MNSNPDIFPELPPLREVIAKHDLRAEKKFGQNFLLDGNITDKIARAAGDMTGVHIVEIGPGPGGLTRSLLRTDAIKVSAIEFDPRAVAALQDLKDVFAERLHIIEGDALELDIPDIAIAPRKIIANLPYTIATPLLVG
nr:16S rRNA (adenine(1518)-N(6)/adenine(1519)-N(6))-dimethyltransferase [Micavibrio sp.]